MYEITSLWHKNPNDKHLSILPKGAMGGLGECSSVHEINKNPVTEYKGLFPDFWDAHLFVEMLKLREE